MHVKPRRHGTIDAADLKPRFATHHLHDDTVQVTAFMPPECSVRHVTSSPMASGPAAKDDACGKMVQRLVAAGALNAKLEPIGLRQMRV